MLTTASTLTAHNVCVWLWESSSAHLLALVAQSPRAHWHVAFQPKSWSGSHAQAVDPHQTIHPHSVEVLMGSYVLLNLCTAELDSAFGISTTNLTERSFSCFRTKPYLHASECTSRLGACSHILFHLSDWHLNHCFVDRETAMPAVGLLAWHQPLT